jgi:hypothetical protein
MELNLGKNNKKNSCDLKIYEYLPSMQTNKTNKTEEPP